MLSVLSSTLDYWQSLKWYDMLVAKWSKSCKNEFHWRLWTALFSINRKGCSGLMPNLSLSLQSCCSSSPADVGTGQNEWVRKGLQRLGWHYANMPVLLQSPLLLITLLNWVSTHGEAVHCSTNRTVLLAVVALCHYDNGDDDVICSVSFDRSWKHPTGACCCFVLKVSPFSLPSVKLSK